MGRLTKDIGLKIIQISQFHNSKLEVSRQTKVDFVRTKQAAAEEDNTIHSIH